MLTKRSFLMLIQLSMCFSDVPIVQFRNPTTVSISDSGSDRVRVSWGPVEPSRVRRYQVEYAVLPGGQVQTVVLRNHENTTLLTQLQPNSQYLVTVSAQLLDGQETAMSVKACTQEGKAAEILSLTLSSARLILLCLGTGAWIRETQVCFSHILYLPIYKGIPKMPGS